VDWYTTKQGLVSLPEGDPAPPGGERVLIGEKRPALLELGQFLHREGKTYCFRRSCSDCPHEVGCQREEVPLQIGPGSNLRRAIRAAPGKRLAALDYAGIELRLAAEFSGQPEWIHALSTGGDMHTSSAVVMFHTQTPTKDQRKKAKVCNFNLLYLGGPGTIRQKTGCSEDEARSLCESWWAANDVYEAWTRHQWSYARTHRCVRTHFGRVRAMEELIHRAELEEAQGVQGRKKGLHFARATACNSVIQGSCADIIKISLVKIQNWIDRERLRGDVQILLSVHDEIVLQVTDDAGFRDRVDTVARLMVPEMGPAWRVPILIDAEVGENWADLENLDAYWGRRSGVAAPVVARNPSHAPLVLRCAWGPEKVAGLLNLILDEVSIRSDRTHDEVKVPLRLQLLGEEAPSGSLFAVATSVIERAIREYPGLELTELGDEE
jgi:hypothetical protein